MERFLAISNGEQSLTAVRFAIYLWLTCAVAAAEPAKLTFQVEDEQGTLLPSMIILRPVVDGGIADPVVPMKGAHWRGFASHLGRIQYEVESGDYRYVVDRSSEYAARSGHVTVAAGDVRRLRITLPRQANLRKLGWYSGDLHIHRPASDADVLAQAADLDLAPIITWWNRQNQAPVSKRVWNRSSGPAWTSLTAGEDERQGGALLYFGLRKPIDITGARAEAPSPLSYVEAARSQTPNVWIDIEKPFWWDVPVWIANGVGNSIGICNNHMQRDGMLPNEAWGYGRDETRLPSPLGNGYWTQELYYHLLNSGIRIPPSAGSASGVLNNPVGYNRVYVHLDEPMSPDAWWNGLAAGRCFVTNGPLLLCRINGRLPGAVFEPSSNKFVLDINAKLISRDEVASLELIVNGKVAKTIPLHQPATHHEIRFQHPCTAPSWVLVRAITTQPETFRFASTGPYYIEGKQNARHIDRSSVDFLREWTRARIARIRAADLLDNDLEDVLSFHLKALEFWATRK